LSEAGKEPTGRRAGAVKQMGLLLRVGVAIAAFTFAGYGLDRVLGTSPWMVIAGVLIGSSSIILYLKGAAGERRGRHR
jgi:F0F1-type ATP synthase assembly protein I